MQELLKEFSDTLGILNELSSSPYGLPLGISRKGVLLMVEPALVESNFNGNLHIPSSATLNPFQL